MNKEHKEGLVPVLRFPEFLDSGEWKIKQLNELVVGEICCYA